ncbi:hypothetical protein BH09ACT12_BH09ACT12_12300 [soil metagenome]
MGQQTSPSQDMHHNANTENQASPRRVDAARPRRCLARGTSAIAVVVMVVSAFGFTGQNAEAGEVTPPKSELGMSYKWKPKQRKLVVIANENPYRFDIAKGPKVGFSAVVQKDSKKVVRFSKSACGKKVGLVLSNPNFDYENYTVKLRC